MNAQEFADTHGLKLSEVFEQAWYYVFNHPCKSNTVTLDAARYAFHKRAPEYVTEYLAAFEKAHQPREGSVIRTISR